ncbi:MAG TPA: M14 family zinc carboxypeptidase [Steroidobacteraceae bacterium]|nr:M14 family zinc carboxypeptidase [Steroidobacteraceae bacterium]
MNNQTLMTLAEQSNYRETGRLQEVERLCEEFARAWPEAVRSFEFGRSAEGRVMRALLVSRSGALTPADLRAKAIPLLMLQGGIHPGESDGKDAGFIALRELLEGSAAGRQGVAAEPLLGRIAVLFVPAFNTDGHERFGRWNRPNQNGPLETGWRTTAQNINLNRDYMKADTPEMRAMLRLIAAWDPLVCADLHVTDGADFEPDISLQVEPLNQGDATLRASGRRMRDALIARLIAQGSMALDFYPDLASTDDPASGFALTVYSPRFSTGYFPQRNRFTVLVETHSWKDYAHRVRVMRNTVVSLAELVAAHGGEWLDLAHQADQSAMKLGGAEMALDFSSSWREPARAGGATVDRDGAAEARTIEFRGYAYTRAASTISGGLVTTYDPKTPQIWRVPLRDHIRASVTVTVPLAGYVVPTAFAAEIAARLEAHGVAFSRLRHGLKNIRAQAFRANEVKFSAAPFEGRMRAQLSGAWHEEMYSPQEGALGVPIAQPLARLVVALFEPHAPDSLVSWGLFNACFEQKEQMEPYVAEQIAREMLDKDPRLAAEFMNQCERDAAFAASPAARLEFFLRRHASWDTRYNLYPVLRIQALSLSE